jgi:TolB protein
MSPARFGAVDRIAVLAPDGGVSTIRPDGTGGRVVSPGSGGSQQQVAWSPGGRRLAWGRAERRGGDPARSSLVTADPDGGDRVTTVLPTMPFYLWWRPDGRAVACLANGPQGIDLIVAEPGGPARVALRGAPLFFSWAPDGRRLVGHVDDERLVVVSGDPGGGEAQQQLAEAEGFTSPAWLDDGIVADVSAPDGRRLLALLDPATGHVRRPLARHDGWARVVAPRAGPRLAVCVGPLDPGRDRSVLVEDGEAIPEALTVVDLASGSLDVVLAYPPVAAEWSPDGRRLLVLVTEPGGPAPTRLRWLVWDGGEARPVGDPFVPTSWWARTELAFAEQFAQSRRTWSPDSRSITYAAQSPAGGSVIVVQSVDVSSDNAPREICRGLAASWSPA